MDYAPRRQKGALRGPEISIFQCCISERILTIGSTWKVHMAPKITSFSLKNTNTMRLRHARLGRSHLISCERELFFSLHVFLEFLLVLLWRRRRSECHLTGIRPATTTIVLSSSSISFSWTPFIYKDYVGFIVLGLCLLCSSYHHELSLHRAMV